MDDTAAPLVQVLHQAHAREFRALGYRGPRLANGLRRINHAGLQAPWARATRLAVLRRDRLALKHLRREVKFVREPPQRFPQDWRRAPDLLLEAQRQMVVPRLPAPRSRAAVFAGWCLRGRGWRRQFRMGIVRGGWFHPDLTIPRETRLHRYPPAPLWSGPGAEPRPGPVPAGPRPFAAPLLPSCAARHPR